MAAIISLISERNIVFHVVELAGLLGGRRRVPRFRRLGLHRGLGARLAAALAAAEHLHHVGADLGGVAVLTLLVLPLARAQAAFDVDLRALLEVFAGDGRQLAEERDPVPFGRLFHFAALLVLPAIGRSDADVGY